MKEENGQKIKKLKILAMSDTHDFHQAININLLPQADIFIHAGDFTQYSLKDQHEKFIQFLKKLPYKHKIVVAGNHDFVLDKKGYNQSLKNSKHTFFPLNSEQQIKALKQDCIYLEHESIQIQGIKIFGSPYSLQYFDWGFMYKQSEAQILMSCIPENTDVLITHGPPFGILDTVHGGFSVGCKQLRKVVQKIKPQAHIFGHIHESYGFKRVNQTNFYNASFVNMNYMPGNQPHLIQVQVRKKSKQKI